VVEGDMMTPVFCDGDGSPPPQVTWFHEQRNISQENTLDFTDVVTRSQSGEYTCHIANIHGSQLITVNLVVQHPPQCYIRHQLVDEELVLTCSAQAVPGNVNFRWGDFTRVL